MGAIADLLANATTFKATAPRNASNEVYTQLKGYLDRSGDIDYPTSCAVKNEVQSIAIYGGSPSGGNVKLGFNTYGTTTQANTANIAYNANSATIQTAVNTLLTNTVSGYTNGDVAITGGPLTTTPLTITFSGASVASRNHGQTAVDASGVTGGTAGAASTTTSGQTARSAWAILIALGLTTSDPPNQGVDVTSVVSTFNHVNHQHQLSAATIRALINEACAQDANESVKTQLLTAFGL